MTESQHVEWKESWRDDYLKWICGFANAQGGVLQVGRNDRGKVVGVKDVLRLLEEIPNKAQSALGIIVDVNLRSEDGTEYVEIVVGPYPNPISYKGEFHYRSGSTKHILRGAELNRFLMRKHGRTWDDVPMPGVRVGDLDGAAFDEFRKLAAASERLPVDVMEESNTGVIEKLNLREGRHLKRAAVLLFHSTPQRFIGEAYVKIGYFRGSELLYQDVIEGNLFTQVDRIVDLLYTKYTRALVSYRGVSRVETFPVPRDAIREAVVNAVIHRDYTRPAPSQIRVYDDRIMLWNPGRLPEGWSLDKLTGNHPSQPHNPVIANAFFRAGLIEAWGRGVQRIMASCKELGSPLPEWRIEPEDGLWVEFPFSARYQAADARVAGKARVPETAQETVQEVPHATQETTQEPRETAQEAQETIQEVASTTQETPETARESSEAAQETVQEARETAQEVPEAAQETALEVLKTIQEGVPPAQEAEPTPPTTTAPTSRERILALLKAEPRITRRLLAERIGITPSGVKYHLTKLRKAGIIRHVGPTKAGRWEVLK